MQKSFIRKPVSILLSLLLVLSVFGGLAIPASAQVITGYPDIADMNEGDIFTNFTDKECVLDDASKYYVYISSGTYVYSSDVEIVPNYDEIVQQQGILIKPDPKGKLEFYANSFDEEEDKLTVVLPYDAERGCLGNAWKFMGHTGSQSVTIEGTTIATPEEKAAFESYRTEKKAAMDALAAEGDSEAVLGIIGLAKTQISGFVFDESKTLDENKAALDDLVKGVPAAVAYQRAVDNAATEDEKTALNQAISDAQKLLNQVTAGDDYAGEADAYTSIIAELQTQIDAAQAVADTELASSQQVTEATAALKTATRKADFDATKTALANQLPVQFGEDGDSEAVQKILSDGAAALLALTFDPEKSDLELTLSLLEISGNVKDALDEQRKQEFDTYKAQQKTAVQALAAEGDSDEVKAIVAPAVTAIDEIEYDVEKTLAVNKSAIAAIVEQVVADVTAQKEKEAAAAAAAEAAAVAAAKAELNEVIADAQSLVEDLNQLDNPAYTALAAELQTAVDDAKAVAQSDSVTSVQVTEKAAALQDMKDRTYFNAYKVMVVEHLKTFAQTGDSEAVQQILSDVIATVNAVQYDPEKTLEEMGAPIIAATNGLDARLKAQRKADFEAYKESVIESLTQDGDSDEMQAIAAEALPVIDACVYDDEKTPQENKEAVDAAAKPYIDRIDALRAVAANAVEEKINAIGTVEYTDTCKAKIDAARAAYDALTGAQKALVKNYDVLTAAEARYAELKAAAETPDQPDKPDTPSHPDKPSESGKCKWCGKHHSGFWGGIVKFWHNIFYFWAHLFGRR